MDPHSTHKQRTFILRARAAPTDSQRFLAGVGTETHTEVIAHTLMNALFVAQSHRADVVVHIVLESTQDFSRTVTVIADELQTVGGFHEQALLTLVARALDVSVGMGKEQRREVCAGVSVQTTSFEALVKSLATDHTLYVMDPKGEPLDQVALADKPCFILTDHIPMPKNSLLGLKRLGARKLSLGRTMLFASQCVVLLHHALDPR
jgi:tRNA (pseudouridine54-N1)-methyltransferase